MISGPMDTLNEEWLEEEEEEEEEEEDEDERKDENPAKFSPMELLLRRVIKLPDFHALGLNQFNPNLFKHEVRRLQTRKTGKDPDPPAPRPMLSLETSMETTRILNTPIPSLLLRRMDPSFIRTKVMNGPILPEHQTDPSRVPIGLPLETYMAIMEQRAQEAEERERLEELRRIEAEKRTRAEQEKIKKKLEKRRRQLEEEEEQAKWDDAMRKATEGKTLIEKVAVETEMLKRRDEELRKKIMVEVREEEVRVREGREKEEEDASRIAERAEKKKRIVTLRDFMERGEAHRSGSGSLDGVDSSSP
ncbi:hypothetical protein HDU67_005394, partial [Dinochytrium kinnereticum]